MWDKHAAYYLLAGADPDLRNSGASSLLAWEALMRARERTDVFDFHGSMLRPVERFFRAFGARQTPYLSVTRTTTPSRAASRRDPACAGSAHDPLAHGPPRAAALRPTASRA